ncbi:MAG: hypothetical protein II610_11450 [Treponema sp.]|nr:hypothetical protein [Treponema sp.]
MKSRFFFNAVLIFIAAAFVLPLFSCSDASNDVGSGMVSFYVDKALMQKAVELSDKVSKNPNDEPQDEGERKLRFEVALEGEYKATKTVYASFKEEPYTEDPTGDEPRLDGPRYNFDSFSIDFAGIPVGKTVWAKIKVYEEYEQERDEPVNERREPLLYGKSQIISVSSGTNLLSVGAYSYRTYVPYKFTIQFDQEPDFSTCSYNRICAVDPASKFVAKLRAAKDDLDRYEVCNQFEEKYSEDCWLGEMDLNYDAELSYSEDRKTVTAEGDMWIFVSEDDPASRAATALFVLICQNYSGKTKYYGMASSAMAPMKKQENMASISAQKLNVIDTPYALYNLNRDEFSYKYYLSDDPSTDLSGPEDFSSGGSSGSIGTYEQSFCYDADGNFYVLSVNPDDSSGNWISSGNSKIGSGGNFNLPSDCGHKSIACDLKQNKLYLYGGGDLYATGDFITTGAFDQTRYNLIAGAFSDANISENFAIYDGVAYFALTGTGYYIAKADLSKATADGVVLEEVAEIPVEEYVYPEISDMIAVDDAVYVILRDITAGQENGALGCYWDGTSVSASSVTSRGCVVKCDLKNGNRCKKLGWNDNTVSKESLKDQAKMYLARLRNPGDAKTDDYNIYNDNEGKTIFLAEGAKGSQYEYGNPDGTGALLYTFFPDLQACFGANKAEMESNLSSCFASPAKFIAIKPKKLVISDDGLAFYTDALGGLAYKNVDRVVTIDLEKFAIESVKATSAQFERQLSGWFSADIEDYENTSLFKITGGGTFYAAFEIYYRGSTPTPPTYNQVGANGTNTRAVFLAIKNGDEE